jgi:hypothetical protein
VIALPIQQQMIITEMAARYVPVEFLGLETKSEHVGKQGRQRGGNIPRGIGRQVCRCLERSHLSPYFLSCLSITHVLPGKPANAKAIESALRQLLHRDRQVADRLAGGMEHPVGDGSPDHANFKSSDLAC